MQTQYVCSFRRMLRIVAVGLLALGANVSSAALEAAPPRAKVQEVFQTRNARLAEGAAASTERSTLIGFSRIDELGPIPPGSNGNLEGQPTGVPIPIFRVISDEEFGRGGVAASGAAEAIVFRQSYDSGWARFMKSETGNFIANLLHLGNGFPLDGGQITRYDTMIYNSVSSPGGNAAATISLWDGDPLGTVDTGSTGTPTQIANTTCTFSDMEQAGVGATCVGGVCEGGADGFSDGWACTDDSDCGLCPGATGGTDDACPGLFFLSCDLGGKVDIPSRNIWMVIEWTAGCRMGWRLAIYAAPEIAAAGEENYCSGTCPGAPGPCVDMIFEYYDAASQANEAGVGTCCEDDSIACDHSDGTYECGHPTSCSDGVATDENYFCYGAPDYYASFVASIYANTDTTISLIPTEVVHKDGTAVAGAVIAGNTVTVPSTGTPADVYLDVMVAGWGGVGNATQLKTWQVQIDSATYANGVGAALTSPVHACTTDADCYGLGGNCEEYGVWAGFCAPAWQNCGADAPGNNICFDLSACDLSTPDYKCGSTVFVTPVTDPGKPSYGMSLAIRVPNGAKGTYSVGFIPDPDTFLRDQDSAHIPLIAYVPAEITIPIGVCCDLTGEPGNFVCIGEGMSEKDCLANGAGFVWTEGGTCDDGSCDHCGADADCDDGDACTDDTCNPDGSCSNVDNFPPGTCCQDGVTCTIDDGNPCTADSCSAAGNRGNCTHTNEPDGTSCGPSSMFCFVDWCVDPQDGGPSTCEMVSVNGMPCTVDEDCPVTAGDPPTYCENGECVCDEWEPVPCCNSDGTCSVMYDFECTASGGIPVSECQGDNNGNGMDDACDGIIPPGSDCWRTPCGASKFSFANTPIPGDFFEPGSEPFDGVIYLGGSGEGANGTDTSISRTEWIIFGPLPSTVEIPIELIALSLVNCEPVVVQTSGSPVEWNVRVELSAFVPPQGTLAVTKTHPNRGTFTADFYVQPKFTFTSGAEVRVLDTGDQGTPPMQLQTVGTAPWVHVPNIPVLTCGSNFVPGMEEDPVTGEQCCRKIGHAGPGHIHETAPPDCSSCPKGPCCLPDGTCQVVEAAGIQTAQEVCETAPLNGEYKGDGKDCSDSDGDGIPDVIEGNDCDPPTACNSGTNPGDSDSDGDGCLDGEEIAAGTDPCDPCDPPVPCSPPSLEDDCHQPFPAHPGYGTPDECDIANGTSQDSDGDGIPDECETGACCYFRNNQFMCDDTDMSELMCPVRWVNDIPEYLGMGTECPTESASSQVHDGHVVVHITDPAQDCGGGGGRADCVPGDPIDPWRTAIDAVMCHQFGVDPINCPASCGGGECSPPIPADFFGPGSDPYDGSVCLEGSPLGVTPFGDFPTADTLIRRSADPFDRCDLPSNDIVEVEAEVVALSLVSVDPIVVTFNGGQNPELWDVAVGLSSNSPPPGSVTAVKTHCNGGTYNSVLNVLPKFTFTKVGGGGEGVLDTGAAGICPVELIQNDNPPWTSDVSDTFGLPSPICTDFHPGVEDPLPAVECDCNSNGIRDECDVESQTSGDCNENGVPDECELAGNDCNNNGVPDECEQDCNANAIPDDCDTDPTDPDGNGLVSADCNVNSVPDECEPDCNGNGIADECDVPPPGGVCTFDCSEDCNENGMPDECEPDCNGNEVPDSCELDMDPSLDCQSNGRLDECDIAGGVSLDCNENAVPDWCDITEGTSLDNNGNGTPDECEPCTASLSPATDPNPNPVDNGFGTKNRYLSFVGGDAGQQQAVQVTFDALPAGFEYADGRTMWVQEPFRVDENSAVDGAGEPGHWAATLGCSPYYADDWDTYGAIDVNDPGVIPGGTYSLRIIDETCDLLLAGGYSGPLEIVASAAGDLVESCSENPCTAPEGTVNFVDISGVVDKFKNLVGAPRKARADLVGNSPTSASINRKTDFVDIGFVVDAFRSIAPPPEGPPELDPCE